VLQRLQDVHLKLNLSKCYFGTKSLTFLGHVVSVEGSYPNPKKVAIVEGFPIFKFVTNVRALLGLIGYYNKFILGCGKIAKPLFGLTKKDCKFLWTPMCQGAFVTQKRRLMESLVLKRLDFS